MKKRVISVFMVFIIAFSFPVSAGAVSVMGIISGLMTAFDIAKTFLAFDRQDIVNSMSDEEFQALRDKIASDSKTVANQTPSGDFVNAQTYTFPGNNGDVTFSRDYIIQQIYNNDHVDVSGYKWFCFYINDSAGDMIECVFFLLIRLLNYIC